MLLLMLFEYVVLLCTSSSAYVQVSPKPADPPGASKARKPHAVKIHGAALATLHLPQPSTTQSEVSGGKAESHPKVTSASMLRHQHHQQQQQQQQHAMLLAISTPACIVPLVSGRTVVKQCYNSIDSVTVLHY